MNATAPTGGIALTRAWLSVGSVALGIFTLMTTELLPVGLLMHIATEQGVTAGRAGLLLTAPGVVAAVAAPMVMVLAGRVDRRLMLCGLMALLTLANLMTGVTESFSLLVCARVLVGLSIGGFWAIAGGLALRLVPTQSLGLATSLIFAGVSAASVLGVPAGTLIGDAVRWRMAFLVLAALSGTVLLALAAVLPALPAKQSVSARDLVRQCGRSGILRGLLLTGLLVTGQFTAFTFFGPALHLFAGVTPDQVGKVLLVYGVCGFMGNFVAGVCSAQNVHRTLMGITGTLSFALMLLATVGQPLGLGLVLTAVWGLAYGGASVALQTWMMKAAPHATEATTALFVATFNLSIALGALIGGFAMDLGGVRIALVLAALLVMAAAVMLLRSTRPHSHPTTV